MTNDFALDHSQTGSHQDMKTEDTDATMSLQTEPTLQMPTQNSASIHIKIIVFILTDLYIFI
jgi:hypothetical protein